MSLNSDWMLKSSSTYSEENKYLNTLLFCKFSHSEIMEGSEIVIIGACPLWETI